MQERRQTPRQPSFKAGRILFHTHWPTIDCTVRNHSSAGACIELPGECNVTLGFALTFAREHKIRGCRQIWRQGKRIGVAFA